MWDFLYRMEIALNGLSVMPDMPSASFARYLRGNYMPIWWRMQPYIAPKARKTRPGKRRRRVSRFIHSHSTVAGGVEVMS